MTPTARTLQTLRKEVFVATVVEKWIAHLKIRKDAFGADILAANPLTKTVLLIQATTASNLASRIKKTSQNPDVKAWVNAGGAFECWGWQKRDGKWEVRRVAITADSMSVELTLRTRRSRKRTERTLFDDLGESQ